MNDPTASATNSKLFAMQLYYNTDMSSTLTGTAQYNGNINGELWRLYNDGSNLYKGYNFTYDGLNRLTQADYGTYSSSTWTNTSAYDLSSVGYDENGNISSLTRKNYSGSNRESLSYTYSGNQLSSISGTYNGSSASGSFSYDGNGNASSDGLRGLTSIIFFDELDLPSQYYKNSGNKVDYTYDALGAKWSKTATISGTATTMLYYGPFIYESGSLSKVLTPEGYYDPTTSLYHYYLKDHLGNTRITFHYSGTTAVVDQEVEYYPFGTLFADNNLDKNIYLYNGKELNNEFFENYDYGARFYDPELARWHSVDPHSENYYSWTPYNYVADNPINLTDPIGMDWYRDEQGNTMWQEGSVEVDGYTNIGANYTMDLGKGVSMTYTQNEVTSMTETVLNEDNFVSMFNEDGSRRQNADGTNISCYDAAAEQLEVVGTATAGRGTEVLMTNATTNGTAGTTIANAVNGVDVVNGAINAGNPIMVGVDYHNGSLNIDGMTDHFIAISGRTTTLRNGAVTGISYNFFDNRTRYSNYGTQSSNTLNLNNNRLTGTYQQGRTVYNYIVTTVRRNR